MNRPYRPTKPLNLSPHRWGSVERGSKMLRRPEKVVSRHKTARAAESFARAGEYVRRLTLAERLNGKEQRL